MLQLRKRISNSNFITSFILCEIRMLSVDGKIYRYVFLFVETIYTMIVANTKSG